MANNSKVDMVAIIKAIQAPSFNFWNSKNLLTLIATGEGAALIYSSLVLDGHQITDPLFWFAIPRGIMGLATCFAAAYAAYELPRIGKSGKGPAIQRLGFVALGCTVISTIVVMSICTAGTPDPFWKGVASVAFAIMPEAGGLAVAFASGRFFTEEPATKPAQATGEQTAQPAKADKKSGKQSAKVAEQPAQNQPAEQEPALQPAQSATPAQPAVSQQPVGKMAELVSCKWGCGETGSRGKMNGHSSQCQNNPASKNYKQPAGQAA